ncbi:MAG: DUF1823 family protein [Cyanobacteria bacterium RI_101]|nr:DUF1823 family protein [Cyanobacteria bacterium RI_101]
MKLLPPLTEDTLWGILRQEVSDDTVNQLLAESLGYRFDPESQTWDCGAVEESWRGEYPEPPDFLENRPPMVKLTRSIPAPYKQLLKEKLGFGGYKIGEFTPNHTRRATAVSWFLYLLEMEAERAS